MSTWRPRTAFGRHVCSQAGGPPMASGPPWRKSASVSDAKDWSRLRASPNPIPFSPGIADWWLRDSTAPSSAARRAGRAPVQRSRIWWFAWLARTPAGAMTGWWEHWPTWGIRCPTRPWAISCAGMETPLCRRGARQPPGGTSFAGTWMFSPARTSSPVEVLTWRGLVTSYVLFFIHLDSRRVSLAGITDHPEACWMRQVACNATLEGIGQLNGCRYVLHDRDAKFCAEFRETLAAGGVECLRLPPHSPNLNAFAERWVRSVKEECLSHLILFGERSLRKALIQFQEHYHAERNHQGKNNVLLFPAPARLEPGRRRGMRCRERLGGLLRYYSRAA